ncbi:unnamed protein product [Rotaria socialis]|uniref:PDZ domain-containing protein n=1 Tax=Rotaria socialis TaxID=392032 RepID=A0A820TDX2_9BILA|nr:unnamed protein product [Rotaria socialis]
MMQVGANQSTAYHSQPSLAASSGQTGRSSSTSRQQQQSQYDTEQLANIRPRLCLLRKWPHYDGYGVHLARNQHWLGLRIGDVEPNSPAESGGLLSEDVVLSVNGHSVENDDFFVILSFIQHELEDNEIRFLVLDPHSADLARRHHLNIDENYRTCVRMETPTLTVSPEKLLYDQWRTISNADPTAVQNTINLGPTVPLNQNQPTSSQQHQEKLPHEGPDNGKSFFDVLFHQEKKSPSTNRQQQPQDSTPQTPSKSRTGDNNDNKNKNKASIIDHGIDTLVNPNIGAAKSVPPTKHDDDDDSISKSSDHLIDRNPTTDESPLLKNEYKDEVAKPNNASNSNDQEKPPPPYENLWQASCQQEDTNNNLRPEPRMCSLTLRPGIDTIGISLQPDKDFGHIIKHVEPSSLANRAGIEPDDCIVSLNHTPLLNIPYEDVLNTLKKNRNDSNLDFVVAKKSYLLKSRQKNAVLSNTQSDPSEKYSDTPSNTTAEVLPSSNISGRNIPSTTGAAEALEELYNKYSNDRQSPLNDKTNYNRPRETVSTTTTTTTDEKHDRLSPQLNDDRYATKSQQGQILQGVGPATADRSSWGASNGKSSDLPAPISGDSSVRSNIGGRKPDTDDTKGRGNTLEDGFKPLQVGITNQTGNISPTPPSNLSSRPTSSIEQRDSSPKALQISDTTSTSARGDIPSSRQNQSIQNIPAAIPIVPIDTSYSTPDYEQKTSQVAPSNQSDLRLENTPDSNTIPTKSMSVPSKPIKANVPLLMYDNATDDDDDDDLSDISERSLEDDTSEPLPNKLSQVLSDESDNIATPYSESLRKPIVSGIHKPETTPDYGDERLNFPKDINNKQALSAPMPDVDQPSIVPSPTDRQIVQARRLEQSDSEDTTSGADSHNARRSIGDTFYSPDESMGDMNDIDDQQSKPLPAHLQQSINPIKSLDNKQDQSLSKPLNQQQKLKNYRDEDSDRSIESNSENTPVPSEKMMFAKMPISELKNYGYEFHNIQLMQPTETSPVGLKLTKQQDPLQYIITAVAKGTKADLAGLKVNDWLIKIEDADIRTTEFSQVSHDIRELLTNAGLINMVIARKKTSVSPPTIRKIDKESTPISPSSRADSLSRQQGGQIPASLLTTDITRDTPDNNQVRFVPDRSVSPPTNRSQRSPVSNREINTNAPGGPYSVGLTNPISDENLTKSPRSRSRSPSHSPTREYTVSQPEKKSLEESQSEEYDDRDIRLIVLKEALGLDFNSFIPESDSQVQTHFISNVQPLSLADKAGLRDGDRILTVNNVDVTHAIHEDVRRMMQTKKPLQLTVVNDPKYIELIENVKRNQTKTEGNTHDKKNSPPLNHETVESLESDSTGRSRSPVKPVSSDPISDLKISPSKSLSPSPLSLIDDDEDENDELSKHRRVLFTDDKGSVKIKHCILRKDPTYNGFGLVLRYQNGLHLIDQVEEGSPAYIAGLREDDIILYADKKNVEQLTHDDVKIIIRKLSVANMDIDLILMKKSDIPRYESYEEKNSINWKPILGDNRTEKTEQSTSSSLRGSNDQTNNQRKSSSSSNKQAAPVAPASSTSSSNSKPATRVCILQPSADRTAGFALSGKTAPPYVICQVEGGSPAEKAGLLINDALLSINGKSVTETTYEETVKLIKEALQKKNVELVVREKLSNSEDNTNNQYPTKFSVGSIDNSSLGNKESIGGEPSQQGANAVEEYQKQRNKELSYTLRLCHLLATNGDGTQAATFGFELSEDPDYEYPIILRVEPQSPADVAGLQSHDVLLKINERKTKGLGYDKVEKEIEKAKRDGRLEMLVVDQEAYDYCERMKKPLKEPEMKVKHIFPKSRSSASFHKLPSAAAVAAPSSMSPRDSTEQLSNSNIKSNGSISSYDTTAATYHLAVPRETDSENDDDHNEKQNIPEEKSSSLNASQAKSARQSHPAVSFDLSAPANTLPNVAVHSHESPLKFVDPAQVASQQRGASSAVDQNAPTTSRSTTSLNQTSATESKPSKAKSIPNAINNLFHKIGYSKSSKPDYDTPPKTKANSKARAPSPPTIRVGLNRLEESCVSQSFDTTGSNTITAPISTVHDTVRSTVSTGSFDYLRNPRRCVLKVDRNKGLGFVLSATGDYDHTITAVEKYSAADIAGLQVHDEVFEVDGVNVRNVKYEQVVEMLVSAMRANDTIEMRVIGGSSRDAYPSTIDVDKQTSPSSLLNTNNNNNTAKRTNHSQHREGVSGDDLSDMNSSISPFDSLNQQKIATSYPNLHGQLRHLDHVTNRALSGSVPVLATGITASPNSIHLVKNISISSEKGSISKLSDISTHDAPVARLCRIRKFATSPFYGFFLCGDPKKLGRVFISDVTKHSPAAVCGLRDGDRVIEINGSSVDGLIYETILDKIKHHMGRDDLELLVLDKKSVQWYRERHYPITSRTLPTIVHIEPIINDTTSEQLSSEIPATHTKLVGFADRRVSKTGL